MNNNLLILIINFNFVFILSEFLAAFYRNFTQIVNLLATVKPRKRSAILNA